MNVLGPGDYQIESGYRGYVLKGVLHVVPYIPRGIAPDDKRCRDCKNRIEGRNKRGPTTTPGCVRCARRKFTAASSCTTGVENWIIFVNTLTRRRNVRINPRNSRRLGKSNLKSC